MGASEDAFDRLPQTGNAESPEESADDKVPSSTSSHDSSAAGSDIEASDDGADVDAPGIGSTLVSQSSEHFPREGNRLYWRGAHVGTTSAWKSNIPYHCKLHSACKSPASTCWGTDSILVDWILSALDYEGAVIKTKAEHQQAAIAMKAKFAMPVVDSCLLVCLLVAFVCCCLCLFSSDVCSSESTKSNQSHNIT